MIHLIPGFDIEFFKDETLVGKVNIAPNSFVALAISTTFQADMIELSSGVEFFYTGRLVTKVYSFCVFNNTEQNNTFTRSPDRMSVKMIQ